jgi:hypothetical protein
MVIRAIAGAALLVTVLLLGAETAMACSCAPVDPREKLAGSKGAVTARLLEVRRPPAGEEAVSSADPTLFIYRTGRVVKGAARGLKRGRRLAVQSPLSEASCGLAGEPGGLTGLFLDRENGRWTSNLCNQISRATMLRQGGPKASNVNPGRCRNGG